MWTSGSGTGIAVLTKELYARCTSLEDLAQRGPHSWVLSLHLVSHMFLHENALSALFKDVNSLKTLKERCSLCCIHF